MGWCIPDKPGGRSSTFVLGQGRDGFLELWNVVRCMGLKRKKARAPQHRPDRTLSP